MFFHECGERHVGLISDQGTVYCPEKVVSNPYYVRQTYAVAVIYSERRHIGGRHKYSIGTGGVSSADTRRPS